MINNFLNMVEGDRPKLMETIDRIIVLSGGYEVPFRFLNNWVSLNDPLIHRQRSDPGSDRLSTGDGSSQPQTDG